MQAIIEMTIVLSNVKTEEVGRIQANHLQAFLENRALSNKDAVHINDVVLVNDEEPIVENQPEPKAK